jgi:hypothetical protein
MTRRILRLAVAGVAALVLATPAAADHVRLGSGFHGDSAVEWNGPRIFGDRERVVFVGRSDVAPTLRTAPRGKPDNPRGKGQNKNNDRGKKPEDGFFGANPTVVLPDVTAPVSPGAGLGGQDLSSGPTASTPEPGTLLLLGAGLGGVLLHRARRRRAEA